MSHRPALAAEQIGARQGEAVCAPIGKGGEKCYVTHTRTDYVAPKSP